jgi:hypothetical protein
VTALRIGKVIMALTLVASGSYFVVYLSRWEWNRATTAALIFLAAELGFAAMMLGDHVSRLEHRIGRASGGDTASRPVRQRIAEAAPAPRDHFAWLRSSTERTSVFIPVLMGAGVILSALAWLIERFARATASTVGESALAQRLEPISLPTEPLVTDLDAQRDENGLALLLRPEARVVP